MSLSLASGTVAATKGSWADVSWSKVALTIGQTYFIRTRSVEQLYSAYSVGDRYSGGQIYNSDGSPYPSTTYDLTFRSFSSDSTTAAVPEPATWALAIIGFAVMGVTLRNRRRLAVVAA